MLFVPIITCLQLLADAVKDLKVLVQHASKLIELPDELR